jgi:Fe-S-cluster-containing dehydrogenase component
MTRVEKIERGAAIDRRGFLQAAGFAGAGALATERRAPLEEPEGDPFGVLVDTTMCVGCRTCVKSCAEAHGLPAPPDKYQVATTPTQRCVVQRHKTDDPRVEAGAVFVKRQCMHCLQPACASACLTKAMLKTDDGPVVWRGSKCMGCRYCMVSCPFDMPKFEYDSAVPELQKCDLCAERVAAGERPACVENCPAEALFFGRRSEILAEAHKRIAESPETYEPHIFGEREAGGTSWLYLAATRFESIGFASEMERVSYPTLTREFLYGVPVVLTLIPPLLAGLAGATRREHGDAAQGASHE